MARLTVGAHFSRQYSTSVGKTPCNPHAYSELTCVNVIKEKYTCVQGSLVTTYLGILAVTGACSSGVKVPDSKSCHGNGLIKHE